MKNEHKGQTQLSQEIEQAQLSVDVGAEYRHYKSLDKTYQVIDFGVFEPTDELCVIYQAQYGERLIFVRPLSVWLEQVEWKGEMVPRFSRI